MPVAACFMDNVVWGTVVKPNLAYCLNSSTEHAATCEIPPRLFVETLPMTLLDCPRRTGQHARNETLQFYCLSKAWTFATMCPDKTLMSSGVSLQYCTKYMLFGAKSTQAQPHICMKRPCIQSVQGACREPDSAFQSNPCQPKFFSTIPAQLCGKINVLETKSNKSTYIYYWRLLTPSLPTQLLAPLSVYYATK